MFKPSGTDRKSFLSQMKKYNLAAAPIIMLTYDNGDVLYAHYDKTYLTIFDNTEPSKRYAHGFWFADPDFVEWKMVGTEDEIPAAKKKEQTT